ncbi:hypothetical protein [Salipiger sp. PrR003]|uniref:hypothetical protein n=1 Tax=Salipiger sp. PrR003 TaxID=2706776 RepID=UPI0013D94C3A|nr:hypothetical protein [Salipiger sp. PrR003]NDV52836.1 hypothetical protein [Salipiger sp. PrR003]
MMEFAAGYNKAKADQRALSIEKWKRHCAGLEEQIAQCSHDKQVWSLHYAGLEAERNYLLDLLDQVHGGAENNPARAESRHDIRIPHGPRKGQRVQKRDIVYFKRIQDAAARKGGAFRGWFDMICNAKIFD